MVDLLEEGRGISLKEHGLMMHEGHRHHHKHHYGDKGLVHHKLHGHQLEPHHELVDEEY